ncbi:MAG: mannosyl-3-phosphoglycerate phosphatase-related protein [Synoicihabitans sp.]
MQLPSSLPGPWLIFTDLDGTLLDWNTYSPAIARPSLLRLRELGVPVVFCSSKTATEQRALRQSLGIKSIPSIVENGAAVIVPDAAGLATLDWPPAPGEPGRRVKVLGMPGEDVQHRLDQVQQRTGHKLRAYRHITDAELSALTGLDEVSAGRARMREYSETVVEQFPDGVWDELQVEFDAEGLECRHGGRFHTVTGAGTDKGGAVRLISDLYRAAYGRPITTFGLGDSANDTPLLAAVDHPFLVAREDGSWADIAMPNLTRVPGRGPTGWVEVADALMQRLRDAS